MTEWLAHSARYGCPTQGYAEHIANVTRGALGHARRMLRHYRPGGSAPSRRTLLAIAGDSASFHDFGKLDDLNQRVLAGNQRTGLPLRHEDAGVAALSGFGAAEAAGLVSAHHRGLPRYVFETDPRVLTRVPSSRLDCDAFRAHVQGDHLETAQATEQRFEEYMRRHEAVLGPWGDRRESGLSECGGFSRRLLLSCLVDADHTDTARHYGQAPPVARAQPRWEERLAALDRYVAGLGTSAGSGAAAFDERTAIRRELYRTCRAAETDHPLRSCDAVVGSGKTTAVMAHLLRVAVARGLRHIFVVLPYTNIIKQSVDIYRNALCLDGEPPEEVVAEHHHQAEFKDMDLRYLTTLWRAPIIVTTAVQFFETLGSNKTGRLRKLHELPGSGLFLDEAHAALPSELWPACWNWLAEWSNRWNGHLVLASGSLPAFWTLEDFRALSEGRQSGANPRLAPADVRPLAENLTRRMEEAEHTRVHFATKREPLSIDGLVSWVEQSEGPRLLIVNTVQSAAVLAQYMQKRGTQDVLHLSTALAPIHRAAIIGRITELLESRRDWTLVATSMVESGLNFSFMTGFRQRSSTASLVQTAGRVNRAGEKGNNCRVWDFEFEKSDMLPNNPSLRRASEALGTLLQEGWISPETPTNLQRVCLQAMRHEFSPRLQGDADETVRAEMDMDYPQVAERCRVIDSDTRLVLVDRSLLPALANGGRLRFSTLVARSVQIYGNKIEKLGFDRVLSYSDELYVLPEGWAYDADCFGYMAGWFDRQEAAIPGGFLV